MSVHTTIIGTRNATQDVHLYSQHCGPLCACTVYMAMHTIVVYTQSATQYAQPAPALLFRFARALSTWQCTPQSLKHETQHRMHSHHALLFRFAHTVCCTHGNNAHHSRLNAKRNTGCTASTAVPLCTCAVYTAMLTIVVYTQSATQDAQPALLFRFAHVLSTWQCTP